MLAQDRISLETLRRSMGSVAREVELGRSVVVERRGEEAFALVPMRLYQLLEEERRALVEATGRAREAFADLPVEVVEELVADELSEAGSAGITAESASGRPEA